MKHLTIILLGVCLFLLVLLWLSNSENKRAAERDRKVLLEHNANLEKNYKLLERRYDLRGDSLDAERKTYAYKEAWNQKRVAEDQTKISQLRSLTLKPTTSDEQRDSVTAATYPTLTDSARTYAVAPLVFDSLTFETWRGRECVQTVDHLETSLDSARSQLATGSRVIALQEDQITDLDSLNSNAREQLVTQAKLSDLDRKTARRKLRGARIWAVGASLLLVVSLL